MNIKTEVANLASNFRSNNFWKKQGSLSVSIRPLLHSEVRSILRQIGVTGEPLLSKLKPLFGFPSGLAAEEIALAVGHFNRLNLLPFKLSVLVDPFPEKKQFLYSLCRNTIDSIGQAEKQELYRTVDVLVGIQESLLLFENRPDRLNAGPARTCIDTDAPNGGLYRSSDPERFSAEIDRYPELRPDLVFGDLGSGFGRIVNRARLFHFKEAVGFEADKRLFVPASTIARELGIDGVGFRNENFLRADLTRYNALYIYQPFCDGLIDLAREMFLSRRVRPGTLIISNMEDQRLNEMIFLDKNIFEPVCPKTSAPEQYLQVFRKRA